MPATVGTPDIIKLIPLNVVPNPGGNPATMGSEPLPPTAYTILVIPEFLHTV